MGSCQTFKACYPFFKLDEPFTKFPQFAGVDSWILGHHDTCTYYLNDGRQAFGVCCTNPVAPSIPTEIITTKPDDGQKFNPPTGSVFGSWPPPIPTHPPDHTPATHPPSFGKPVQQITTERPVSTTTWATRPPLQQITTSTTKRPTLIITTPENIFDRDDVTFGSDASCGVKNGNMVRI